jgi:hypothetical protein
VSGGTVLDPSAARRLVEARLGRHPQDMLETAVALEAWAGLPAQRALDTAREVMRDASPAREESAGALPERHDEKGALLDALTFLSTVIAIACWTAPLADRAGTRTVGHAVMLALPVTLGLQWGLSSRYLVRENGRAQLARRRGVLALGALALVGVGWLGLGESGLIAGLLTVTWVAGTVLLQCRRARPYAAGILATTIALLAGVAPVPVLAVAAASAALATLAALRPPAEPMRAAGARWTRVVAATVIGAGTGILLISDPTVTWTEDAVPAVGLLPAAVAGFWGSYRLRGLGFAIPRAAWRVGVDAAPPRGLASAPLRLLLSAMAELLAIVAGLSIALLLLTPWLGEPSEAAGLLVGFGLLAPAMLLTSVLESLGRARVVLFAIACAAAAEAAVRWTDTAPFPGVGLVAAGAVATALLLPVAVVVLGRPARTLATALWIT